MNKSIFPEGSVPRLLIDRLKKTPYSDDYNADVVNAGAILVSASLRKEFPFNINGNVMALSLVGSWGKDLMGNLNSKEDILALEAKLGGHVVAVQYSFQEGWLGSTAGKIDTKYVPYLTALGILAGSYEGMLSEEKVGRYSAKFMAYTLVEHVLPCALADVREMAEGKPIPILFTEARKEANPT